MEYYSALKSNALLRIPWTGSPVIRTQCFHCSSPGSITGQGTKIPTWHGRPHPPKKKKKERR